MRLSVIVSVSRCAPSAVATPPLVLLQSLGQPPSVSISSLAGSSQSHSSSSSRGASAADACRQEVLTARMQSTTAQRGIATLKEGALSAGRALSVESFLGEVVEQLARLVDSTHCSILLVEGPGCATAPRSDSPTNTSRRSRASRSDPTSAAAAPPRISARRSSPRTSPPTHAGTTSASSRSELGLRSCWSVPLRVPDGTILGTFATYLEYPFAPDPEQIETVEAYASIVALGLDSVRRKAELAASYESAVLALTSALDVRDDYTGSHSNATSRLVRDVCARLESRRDRDRDGQPRRRPSRRRQARRPDGHPHQPRQR